MNTMPKLPVDFNAVLNTTPSAMSVMAVKINLRLRFSMVMFFLQNYGFQNGIELPFIKM